MFYKKVKMTRETQKVMNIDKSPHCGRIIVIIKLRGFSNIIVASR